MTLHIPDDLAKQLADQASAAGVDYEAFVVSQLRASVSQAKASQQADLNEVLSPVREAFEQSGMTEDEAVELFEQEKHAMRRGE
ncbi:hypothetical protein Pla123a_35250 [Posidoniimonas polymericola]|uniref:Uncharacterized protein n=1 Tax=Posidoniimonas polymericola TaxID=2528002 RepID=A0A5C5YD44_9BACT|nr:hypothetical protein [Posidoniimonas polymericola]TWT73637.1 hypothetical protein Pla123a_35250 [Posidoniimonas polymericola]